MAAIRAGQLGVPTILVEGDRLGGTCLNIGCIPSKALIHAAEEFDAPLRRRVGAGHLGAGAVHRHRAHRRLEGRHRLRLTSGVGALLKKNGVEVVRGWATLLDARPSRWRPPTVAACASSARTCCWPPAPSPPLPSVPFGGIVVSSTEALSPDSIPKLVVVGGGYIGLELGTVYRKLGAEVAVVEAQDRILPTYDAELTKPVAAALARMGIELHLGRKVLGLNAEGNAVRRRMPPAPRRNWPPTAC